MFAPKLSRVVIASSFVAFGATCSAATVRVGEGADLQLALTNARPGDIIELAPGATFTGNFTLPAKSGTGDVIVVRTAIAGTVAGRVNPDAAAGFAKLRSANSEPALLTAPGASHWRIELVEIVARGNGTAVALGTATAAEAPRDLTIDRAYIHGDAAQGIKRCVALNSASTVISNSYISDCKAVGEDAQAIAGWNGPGPFTLVNNYLEGAGENVLFGGADPAVENLVPSDIVIRGNLIAKPPSWRSERWQVKNLLELKNARRVLIEQNTIEYCWKEAQVGFAVLFTVRNQDGRCKWCIIEDVQFVGNVVRHAGAGVQILGVDYEAPSGQSRGITIRDNVFSDISPRIWGGNGYAFLLMGRPRDLVIDHNTFIQQDSPGLVQVDGPPILGFVFTNNIGIHGEYGFIGTDRAPGNDTVKVFFPASQIVRNVIAGGDQRQFPSGNFFPSMGEFQAQFVAFDEGNYQLKDKSPWHNAGTDGTDLGANLAKVGKEPDREPRRRTGK